MHPLTWPYARLLGKAYAEVGTWVHETLPSGSVLAVRVTEGEGVRRTWPHEVAVSRAAPLSPEDRAAFDADVRELAAYLDGDPQATWSVARRGSTKQGGVAARFSCSRTLRPRRTVSYALPAPEGEPHV